MNKNIFCPVRVNGGRKFRGFGYDVGFIAGGRYQISMTYSVPGNDRVKIWDPVNKKVEIVTERYVHALSDKEIEELGPEYEAHYNDYVQHLIDETLAWTKTKVASEAEAKKYARACLIKHHHDMIEDIDRLLPDERDVVEEIEKVLAYAASWRNYKTNKPATPAKQVNLAAERLIRYRLYKLDGFKEAWDMLTNLRNLPGDNARFPNPDGSWPHEEAEFG